MNSNEEKLYTKIADLNDIYNSAVQIVFIENYLHAQIINTIFISKFECYISALFDYLSTNMILNEKYLNYRVVDLFRCTIFV
jgi:hypothetical protein